MIRKPYARYARLNNLPLRSDNDKIYTNYRETSMIGSTPPSSGLAKGILAPFCQTAIHPVVGRTVQITDQNNGYLLALDHVEHLVYLPVPDLIRMPILVHVSEPEGSVEGCRFI